MEVFLVYEDDVSYDASSAVIPDSIWSTKEKAEARYQELKRDEPQRNYDIERFVVDDVNG